MCLFIYLFIVFADFTGGPEIFIWPEDSCSLSDEGQFHTNSIFQIVDKQTNKKTRAAIPWLWTLFETLRKPWDCKLRQRPLCAFLLFLQPRAAADTVHTCQPAGRRVSRWVGLAPVLTGGWKTRKKKNPFTTPALSPQFELVALFFFFFPQRQSFNLWPDTRMCHRADSSLSSLRTCWSDSIDVSLQRRRYGRLWSRSGAINQRWVTRVFTCTFLRHIHFFFFLLFSKMTDCGSTLERQNIKKTSAWWFEQIRD